MCCRSAAGACAHLLNLGRYVLSGHEVSVVDAHKGLGGGRLGADIAGFHALGYGVLALGSGVHERPHRCLRCTMAAVSGRLGPGRNRARSSASRPSLAPTAVRTGYPHGEMR
jgi:hypothetical protein